VFPRAEVKDRYEAQNDQGILKALGADDVYLAELQDKDYYRYRVHDIQWNLPESLNVSQVLAHRPEICFGAS
jgi:hypothetical protein